uniref:L-lysine epsilon oxidase C-terminal domain-containing protein n=1 Tax=uncultured bacterium 'pool 3 contig00022' TaxID=1497872 RepID=A0A059V8S2_9BACT|nr:hypothetical protein [uncultured bacterium 'pool 3 contig00022']
MLFQAAVDRVPGTVVPAVSSYTRDIWPLVERVFEHARVSASADGFHADFHAAGAASMNQTRRRAVFDRLTNPDGSGTTPDGGPDGNMPTLAGTVRVTPVQYTHMHRWAYGTEGADWTDDWPGAPPPLPPDIDPTQPEELTRAALQVCVGAAMFPGIEASWLLRDDYAFAEPFRLDTAGLGAGDITKQMAVPWQADFSACSGSWWPAARPGRVYPEGGGGSVGWTRDIAESGLDMVEHWYKLGFITEQGPSLVETERQVVCRTLNLVTDRSHFSQDEVAAVLATGTPAVFKDSVYVIAEGFTPAELSVTTATPTQAQLEVFSPAITIRRADDTPVPSMTARPHALLLQDDSLPATLRQRFTFVYQIEFTNANDFVDGGGPLESQVVNLNATKSAGAAGTFVAFGFMHLTNQPNPYMLDGPTHWLSTDVRVFQIPEGETRFGLTIGGTGAAATSFIQDVLSDFNALDSAGHPFDAISSDQQDSRLELSRSVNGQRVFNFAIARVRYIGNLLSADNVRVFFRLFTTAATGLNFSETTSYRRSDVDGPVALLGLQGGRIVTIPCYGDARIDTTADALGVQTDTTNVRTLAPAGPNERHGYFGCWLDLNQTTARFPLDPTPPDGPWTTNLLSIQELIRGMHQCLVAEAHFQPDPIAPGASPASNDNLSQRNLAISESDNPGSAATHTVQHTFEIKASYRSPRTDAIAFSLRQVATVSDDVNTVRERSNAALVAQHQIRLPAGPDELMIRWNNLPRDSEMTLYMPDVDVDEVLRYAGQNYQVPRLERVDPHTLKCLPGDVTYVPLPMGRTRNIAALLTIALPDGVRQKQVFSPTVHQLSGRPRVVIGAFELTIPIANRAALGAAEVRKLSVLRHIARAIPSDDQWRGVFDRYVGQIRDRVRGFGDDPDVIEPSPDGDGVDPETRRGTRLQWLYSLLLTAAVIVFGFDSTFATVAGGLTLLAAVAAVPVWRSRTHVSRCLWLIATIAGIGLGAAVVALLSIVGPAPRAPTVLTIAALVLGMLLTLGVRWRCFRPFNTAT